MAHRVVSLRCKIPAAIGPKADEGHREHALSMIRKSGYRFSEKIMLKQKDRAGWRFEEKSSRSSIFHDPGMGL
jgi:hypothetical protein